MDNFVAVANKALAPASLSCYKTSFNTYVKYYYTVLGQSSLCKPLLHVFCCIAYLVHMWRTNKGVHSCNMFLAAFNHQRALKHMPTVSRDPAVLKLRDAFKKRARKFQSKFPGPEVWSKCLQSVQGYTGCQLIYVFGFLLAAFLGLRSGELFLLERSFIVKGNIHWPQSLMQSGVKAGQVRMIQPFALPLVECFCKFKTSPFHVLDRTQMNLFLNKEFHCALNVARHICANLTLDSTHSMVQVALTLGHQSGLSSQFYVDAHFPKGLPGTMRSLASAVVAEMGTYPKRGNTRPMKSWPGSGRAPDFAAADLTAAYGKLAWPADFNPANDLLFWPDASPAKKSRKV